MEAANDVYVNLAVISRLLPGDRIDTGNRLFKIEKPGVTTSVARFLRRDSRENTIKRLSDLLQALPKGFDPCAALIGLDNLKQTYKEDLTFVASLERIMTLFKKH